MEHSREGTETINCWVNFAKGGAYSHFYLDLHLCINWGFDGLNIHKYVVDRYPYLKGNSEFILHRNNHYFHPGITWTYRTTSDLSLRVLPEGCIFASKGPSLFPKRLGENQLNAYLAFANSRPFRFLASLSVGAGDSAAKSYETGLIGNLPVPEQVVQPTSNLAMLSRSAFKFKRSVDTCNETSHAFRLPWLLQFGGSTLIEREAAVGAFRADAERQLTDIQHEIDELAFDLYELSEEDRALVRQEMGVAASVAPDEAELVGLEEADASAEDDDSDNDGDEADSEDPSLNVQRFLSWCVGVVFGRWDVRFALDKTLIPELQGAFERLPVVAPAGLVGPDGYPAAPNAVASEAWLRARPNVISLPEGLSEAESVSASGDYPVEVAWDGVLVSDPGSSRDLAGRVRAVLSLLFDDLESIEEEALALLRGAGRRPASLEDYFGDTKQFFETHLRQYSKSRRKAPLYWPLQTKSGFTVWLYYPRLTADTLPKVLGEIVGPRLQFQKTEVMRLEETRSRLPSGPDFTRLSRDLEAAKALLAELRAFETELGELIGKGYCVDFNDGVILSAAPLHKLIAWKDAAKEFKRLQKGDYPWATQHGTWSAT